MNTHQWNIIILLILIVQLQFIQVQMTRRKNFRFLMNFSMSCSVIHRQLLMHNVRFYVVIFLQLHANVIYRI